MDKDLGWIAVIVLAVCGYPGFAVFLAFLLLLS